MVVDNKKLRKAVYRCRLPLESREGEQLDAGNKLSHQAPFQYVTISMG